MLLSASVWSPNTGCMTARAIGFHSASITVGPASSYCPLLSASSTGASRRTQSSSKVTTAAASGFGAGLPWSTWLTTGHTGERTSSVAARFMTLTSFASVTRHGNLSNSSTRCTEPYGSSSPCMKPGAAWLFQLSSSPSGVHEPCGCSQPLRKPRHSYWPVPTVGSRRSRPGARRGSRPDVKNAVFPRPAYAQLNVKPNWLAMS
jgi:hypothetical protein